MDPFVNPPAMVGLLAANVPENPKCRGCLHYEPQRGPSGVCVIGLAPAVCGAGESPRNGYAPVVELDVELPSDHTPGGSAIAAIPDEHVIPELAVQVLGEEYVPLVKSIAQRLHTAARESCPLHQQASTGTFGRSAGAMSAVAPPACNGTCRVADDTVAKALWNEHLAPVERGLLHPESVVWYVREVRKGGLGISDRMRAIRQKGQTDIIKSTTSVRLVQACGRRARIERLWDVAHLADGVLSKATKKAE